jgi:hypothetical protein
MLLLQFVILSQHWGQSGVSHIPSALKGLSREGIL